MAPLLDVAAGISAPITYSPEVSAKGISIAFDYWRLTIE
eukprot:gene12543-20611_t